MTQNSTTETDASQTTQPETNGTAPSKRCRAGITIQDCHDPDARLIVSERIGNYNFDVYDRGILMNAPETDMGNAERLIGCFGHIIRYCPKLKRWLAYRDGIWEMDSIERVYEFFNLTARAMTAATQELFNTHYKKCYKRAEALGVELVTINSKGVKLPVPVSVWAPQLIAADPSYVNDATDLMMAVQMRGWGESMESAGTRHRAVETASTHSGIRVEPDELDADNYILNVRNGVLLLRTGKLVEHDPCFLCTKQAPVDFDAKAKSPLFDMLLTDCTRSEDGDERPDLRAFLLRLYGMTLTGDVSEQYLPIEHGAGDNGKSQLNETVAGVMGDYAGLAAPDLLVAKKFSSHPTEVADLRGRRFVVAAETEKGAELRVQFVKWITGNSRLKGRYMRCDFFEFPRTHKTIIETNNRPVITEQTHAIWRRVLLVPFDYRIPAKKVIKDLAKKIVNDEPEGVLARLVEGCLAWQHEGINPPEAVTLATGQYRADSDIAERFIEDEGVIFDPKGVTTSDALAARLARWNMGREGSHKLGRDDLYKTLRDHGGTKDQRRIGADSKMVRCWLGIHMIGSGVAS